MSQDWNRRRFLSLLGQGIGSSCLIGSIHACGRSEQEPKSYTEQNQKPLPFEENNESLNFKQGSFLSDRKLKRLEEVFPQSVASGDPSENGVILWTRLNPKYKQANQAMQFEVARDLRFSQIVYSGQIPASEFNAQNDYAIKIDLDPHLEPFETYYYRFIYGSYVSRSGRCRTLPSKRANVSSLKLGYLSCQDFTNGYYGALDHLSNRRDIDFVVHLGDFVYESIKDKRFQSEKYQDRLFKLPSGGNIALDLDDYRYIYKTYRSDESLRRFLEAHTIIMIPDDHEVANDYYWDYEKQLPGVPDHPYQKDQEIDLTEKRIQLRLAAVKAWYEYTPTRVKYNQNSNDILNILELYREFSFGNLAQLTMIDSRSYRSAPACGDKDFFGRYLPLFCKATQDESLTMLGSRQREWLVNRFYDNKARWSLLGNQTFMGQLGIQLIPTRAKTPITIDSWDGYPNERKFLAQVVKDANLDNFIVLTGDLHTTIASHLKLDYSIKENFDLDNTIGVEFMTPSITSSGLTEQVANNFSEGKIAQNLTNYLTSTIIKKNNPHIETFNTAAHGYSTIEVNDRYSEYTTWAVSKELSQQSNAKAIHCYRKYNRIPLLEPISL